MRHLQGWRGTRHLSDAQLIEVCLTAPAGHARRDRAVEHLRACPGCQDRYADATACLRADGLEAARAADAHFGHDRLARQREQIARRLENLERPVRVIPFPASHRPTLDRRHGATRWVAGAAAAGLLIGLAAGRVIDRDPSVRGEDDLAGTRPQAVTQSAEHAVRMVGPDELLLVEIDAALAGPASQELQAIDAITPHVMEAAFNLRDGA